MKKYVILLILILGIVLNVKADMGPPSVISYDIIITNKDGAYCYEGSYVGSNLVYKKTNKKLSYGREYNVWLETGDEYVSVSDYDEEIYDCFLSVNDVIAKNDEFDLNNEEILKIEKVKAIVLNKDGVLMHKGPASAYSKVTTIPVGSIIEISYKAGTYWYYTEYKGYYGWISGDNHAFGFDNDNLLFTTIETNIYDNNRNIIGKIPAYTNVSNYLELPYHENNMYYVNYNGILGTVDFIDNKVEGKIKVLKDTKLVDDKKNVLKTISFNQEVVYDVAIYATYPEDNTSFYIEKDKGWLIFSPNSKYEMDSFQQVIESKNIKKTSGFIGEGYFGENAYSNTPKNNNSEIIIICVLSAILLAITILIIIKLINNKKEKR